MSLVCCKALIVSTQRGKRTILRQNFRLGYRLVLRSSYGLGYWLGLGIVLGFWLEYGLGLDAIYCCCNIVCQPPKDITQFVMTPDPPILVEICSVP